MKRFYKDATVTGDGPFGVSLDGKALRTPARELLAVPSLALAEAIAKEWQAQGEKIDPRSLPLTGFANAAIDRVAADHAGFAKRLATYAESELIAYRADGPDSLLAAQAAAWDQWVEWLARRYDVGLTITTGIMHVAQPPATLIRLHTAFAAFTPFQLAPLDPIVTITGSAVLALAVAEGELEAEAAYDIAHVDALWQEQQWGRDPLAEKAEAERRTDLAAAVHFLRLLAG
ncbi:ATP12 family protein [Sandarakinorhabdus sp.]|jgi:chaperone required for assembly of F1-ATPase|uniref:ATP12 family chaperone protein n=1 Tax=Sandarakinorhabdus sp. TaxID=1916663 RepID=UPI0028AEF63E|nr:ATP12 family protein [Sandarakinorhabdus sp.]